jgi:hypothetical protein
VGFLNHITNAVSYSQVNAISLELTATPGMNVSVGRVIPQSYAFDATSGLSVLVQNTGDLAVDLTGAVYHEYIILDEDDQALAFGFLDADASATQVATYASARLTDPLGVDFYGTAHKVIAFVDFNVLGGAGALTLRPSAQDQARLDAVTAQRKRTQQALRQATLP